MSPDFNKLLKLFQNRDKREHEEWVQARRNAATEFEELAHRITSLDWWDGKFKPCPFCGKAPVLSANILLSKKNSYTYNVMLSAKCKNHKYGIIDVTCKYELIKQSEDIVPLKMRETITEAWNTRSPNQRIDPSTGLRPCPICGSKKSMVSDPLYGKSTIGCINHDSYFQIYNHSVLFDALPSEERKLIEEWNARFI